jgi:hypothetical protein
MELDWAAKWQKLSESWGNLEPPAIPSFEDVQNFMKLAGLNRRPVRSALVLGSTPALRLSLSHLTEIENLYCVDANLSAYQAMSGDLVIAKEIFVNENWLQMSKVIEASSIDLIFGDKAIDNLPKTTWTSFFKECKKVLHKEGALVLHVGFPDLALQTLSPEAIVRQHFRAISKKNSLERAASSLWEDLLSHSGRFNDDNLTLEPYRLIEASNLLNKAELEFFNYMVGKHVASWESKWSNFDEAYLIKAALNTGFIVDRKVVSGDYHGSSNQPIFRWIQC